VQVYVVPGTSAYLAVNIANLNNTFTDRAYLEYLKNPPLILLKARLCKIGELYTVENTCELCPDGRYTFTPMTGPSKDNQCPACPLNGDCSAGIIVPKAGYVRFHE
jgi:hypothetical protein